MYARLRHVKILADEGVRSGISKPISCSKYSAISVMTERSIPLVLPRSDAYSIAIASRGVLPVRSPMPRSVVFTAEQPYSHAVAELTTAL